jgi:hypothetical protein
VVFIETGDIHRLEAISSGDGIDVGIRSNARPRRDVEDVDRAADIDGDRTTDATADAGRVEVIFVVRHDADHRERSRRPWSGLRQSFRSR